MQPTGTKKSPPTPQTSSTGSTQGSRLLPHINSEPCSFLRDWIQKQRPVLWLLIEGHGTVQRFRATSTRGLRLPNG